MDKDLIGKVTHYYDKIQVAIIKLVLPLKKGDKVKFTKGEDGFEQTIESMQFDHNPVEEGKIGDEIAVKVNQPVKEGMEVYRA